MPELVLSIVFIVLCVTSVVLYLCEKVRKYSVKATLLKTVCSLFFIATAAVGLFKNFDHVFPKYVIIGLLLGMLGDIWLDMKYVYKGDDKPFTYAGFISFALGHFLFMAGMIHEFYHGENTLYIIIPFVAGILCGIATVFLEKPMKLKYGDMKLIVGIYGMILFSMAFLAISMMILTKFSIPLIMFSVGGLLFAVSDLVLSGTYFGEGKERPVDIITNISLYYIAQLSIAFSLFFL